VVVQSRWKMILTRQIFGSARSVGNDHPRGN
jgi:hypothetical protein